MIFTSCSHKIIEEGKASYYADKFDGRQTSNGETFKQRKKTAAHRTLPFGTKVTVTNLTNGRTVKVRINDRGPFVKGRMIDLSKKAAKKLDMVNAGVANVQIKYKAVTAK
jgi:rare lipoprotein A